MPKVFVKREKAMFLVTAAVLIFALCFNFFLAPVLTKNDNLNKEINLAREKLKKYLRLLSQKDYIQKKYSKFSAGFEAGSQQGDILVSALSKLEKLAQDASIKIIDIRPAGGAESLTRYKEILIDLRTEGVMEGYLKFIYNLENSLSLLKIKEFQLSAKPNSQALEGIFSVTQLSAE